MSERRDPKGHPPHLKIAPEPPPSNAPAAGQIQRYVQATDGVLESLRRELDYYRAHNRELVRERNEQLQLLSRVERDRADRAGLTDELRVLKRERDAASGALGPLREESRQLRARCAALEAEVERLRRHQQEAQEIIAYFELQFEEVERIMELLAEHRSFMQGATAREDVDP